MMQQQTSAPWTLGLAGLIPFWALSLALLTGQSFGVTPPTVSFLLATYAATIASFLGGMRWGLAIRETHRDQPWGDYLMSVLPRLVAWAALALPDRPRFSVLALLIIMVGLLDLGLARRGVAPAWFGRLRIVLSLVAGAALIAAATA